MIRNVHSGIISGMEKIKWFFSVLSERIKIEIAVIQLMGKSEKHERQRKKLLEEIGERVFTMKQSANVPITDDTVVNELLRELEKVEQEMSVLRREAKDISALEV